jgi:glycosyltransferase involved in cell wall biosynthesis
VTSDQAGPGAVRPAPRISVVIRCHNYGRFLAEAVASLLGQTRPPDEIVIVDDGSTDETAAVVGGLDVGAIHLVSIRRSPAHGPAASFNDGVRASTGDLVVALDADDRFSPTYLEVMEKALTDDPGLGFAYAGDRSFGAAEVERTPPEFDARELPVANNINVSAMMRRAVFDATGGFRPDFDRLGFEDWEHWLHAVRLGFRGARVEGCHLEYRRHEGGSRDTLRRPTVLEIHLRLWLLHRPYVRFADVVRWLSRSVRRRLPS